MKPRFEKMRLRSVPPSGGHVHRGVAFHAAQHALIRVGADVTMGHLERRGPRSDCYLTVKVMDIP